MVMSGWPRRAHGVQRGGGAVPLGGASRSKVRRRLQRGDGLEVESTADGGAGDAGNGGAALSSFCACSGVGASLGRGAPTRVRGGWGRGGRGSCSFR